MTTTQYSMTTTQYFESLLEQIQPQNIFMKVIYYQHEYPTVIFILYNPTMGSQYQKVYCNNLNDETEIAKILEHYQYKKAISFFKIENQCMYSYSKKI